MPLIPSPTLSPLLRQTLDVLGFAQANMAVPLAALSGFVRHHGVAGLLDSQRLAALPADYQQALLVEQRHIGLSGLQLSAALKRLCDTLQVQGLIPLALKGPALALQAHGKLASRAGVDLDIFLEETHWPQALQALRSLGYDLAPGQSLPLAQGTHELLLLHPQGQPRIELHRRLLRHRFLLSNASDNRTTLSLQGTSIHSLTPAFALPYLVAHANQHCFRRLIWLLDIHALLHHPQLDASAAAKLFVHSGTCGSLDACLSLLSLLFNSSIPEELEAVRRPCRASQRMTEQALQAIEGSLSDDQVATQQGPLQRVLLDLLLHDHWRARWQVMSDWLSPTVADHDWLRLPSQLAFLYPLTRLYRLLARAR